jgi:hypothetical protein
MKTPKSFQIRNRFISALGFPKQTFGVHLPESSVREETIITVIIYQEDCGPMCHWHEVLVFPDYPNRRAVNMGLLPLCRGWSEKECIFQSWLIVGS